MKYLIDLVNQRARQALKLKVWLLSVTEGGLLLHLTASQLGTVPAGPAWVSAQSHSGCNTCITCAPVQTYGGRESKAELKWRHLPNKNFNSNSGPHFVHKKGSVSFVS